MSDCYKNSLQHLQEELKRIDLLIYQEIQNLRQEKNKDIPGEYKGLFISEAEIDEILKKDKNQEGKNNPANSQKTGTNEFNNRLQALNAHISQKTKSTLEKGHYLSLVHLSRLFRLNSFEIDCLLITLAPELDLKYERLYAYLQNDVTKKRPTIDLFLKLLCRSFEENAAARDFFSDHAPLFKYNLLKYPNETEEKKSPLISRALKLDDRIAGFLLETRGMDPRVTPFTNMVVPGGNTHDLIIPEETGKKLNQIINMFPHEKKEEPRLSYLQGTVFCLNGPGNNGQQQVAGAICRELGIHLLHVDMEAMCAANHPLNFDVSINLVLREAALQSCAPYFKGCDSLLEDREKNHYKKQFLDAVKEFSGIIFLEREGNRRTEFSDFPNHIFLLDFPIPSYEIRKKLWKLHLNETPVQKDVEISSLANKFRFSAGQIRDAVRAAGDMALLKKPGKVFLSGEEIYNACRSVSNQKLSTLSRKIEPRYDWDDIILPKDNFTRLKEISSYVKYRHVVYGDWGFDKKLSLGKGLNALFHGPSGTGKTMAAEIIAKDLGLDLYKIDLSNVVSKYIGETEKNLSKIFKEAETSNAIIFFDEADALFGKRSEVKDAHDRYANIEVAYLLQKMEEYEGIVILATNFMKNIDDAFARRMHFSLEFPFPDEIHRLKIWKTIFPGEAPRDEDIDFEFLARKFKIPGGNIKNIILTAAFFAAENSRKIGMKHMILASKREFQKIGKLSMQSDFGKYFSLTRENEPKNENKGVLNDR